MLEPRHSISVAAQVWTHRGYKWSSRGTGRRWVYTRARVMRTKRMPQEIRGRWHRTGTTGTTRTGRRGAEVYALIETESDDDSLGTSDSRRFNVAYNFTMKLYTNYLWAHRLRILFKILDLSLVFSLPLRHFRSAQMLFVTNINQPVPRFAATITSALLLYRLPGLATNSLARRALSDHRQPNWPHGHGTPFCEQANQAPSLPRLQVCQRGPAWADYTN